tara:strand:+ start:1468 stop:1689 length:222 start_codon:yes stop_codon:yes gene_type:complete
MKDNKKKISKKVVDHFIGDDSQDWINDCMYRLMNNKISVSDLRNEAKYMYKNHRFDGKIQELIRKQIGKGTTI